MRFSADSQASGVEFKVGFKDRYCLQKKPEFMRFPGKSENKLRSQQNTLLVHALEQYLKLSNLSLSFSLSLTLYLTLSLSLISTVLVYVPERYTKL